jgi:hypothetical protein
MMKLRGICHTKKFHVAHHVTHMAYLAIGATEHLNASSLLYGLLFVFACFEALEFIGRRE